ncbi:MAG: peptidoglycan-binding protein [Bacillota bacterium]|nr:peptidoglycan-binding protein [Bacillota bacterium]
MKRFIALFCVLLLFASPAAAQQLKMLTIGSSGEAVVKLQQRLCDAGFLSAPPDGRYGQGTSAAVTSAQKALNEKGHPLAADGIAGQATLKLLYDDEVMRPFLDFSIGSVGKRVQDMQIRLIDLKFLDGAADGHFGEQTYEALKAFQETLSRHHAEGVAVNGVMDAATRPWLAPGSDLFPFQIQAPEFFDDSRPLGLTDKFLNADAAVVADASSGRILFAKNADKRMYPASTTKMMTLLLAIERGRLDEVVELPASTAKVAKDSSLVPVYPGEKMTMRDLLYGLMIRSGNDAANAVAEICAGSVAEFVKMMNRKAVQLGMSGTNFTNPHGYHDPDHYSTARDLLVLALTGMKDPDFRRISTALSYTMQPTTKRGALTINNTNELLNLASPKFYDGAYGIKSGYTGAAGFCYVGAAQKDGSTLYAAILKSRTRNRGWDDMKRLFNYGFTFLKKQ